MTTKRSLVVVKHIANEDLEHHIHVLGVKSQRKTLISRGVVAEFFNEISGIVENNGLEAVNENTSATTLAHNGNVQTAEATSSILDESTSSAPALLVDKNAHYAGADIYRFKTPKRSTQMSKFAAESSRKMRSMKRCLKENENPDIKELMPEELCSNGHKRHTSKRTLGKRNCFEAPKKIDYHQKTSTVSEISKKYLVQELQSRQQQDSDSSEDSESEDEETCGEADSFRSKHESLPTETEMYFGAHKPGRKLGATTSDRTLAKLKMPRIKQARMQAILDEIEEGKLPTLNGVRGQVPSNDDKVEISRQRLITDHQSNFVKWMFYICNGYNLLLYGLGSKRKLVQEFCKKMLEEYDKVVVNGYFPSLIVKSIFSSICEVIENTAVDCSQQQAQLNIICQKYSDSNSNEHLFLILHNIDGATLRSAKPQSILVRLAECQRIHIIATIDHINASLIWDQSKLSRFKWIWYDATTYEAYKDETSFENSLLFLTSGTGIGGSLALSGLFHVTRSLTPNARGIFKLLVEFQNEQFLRNSVNYIGVSFSDLYQRCREKFLVNSELTLRTQLTEFFDHKLIQIRKGGDGGECLSIPLDSHTLQEYLDQS